MELVLGQIASWCQANITEENLEDKKLISKNIKKITVPSPLPANSSRMFGEAFDTVLNPQMYTDCLISCVPMAGVGNYCTECW